MTVDTTPGQPADPKPAVDVQIYLKWGLAAALGASVFALVLLGKTPVDTYLTGIVYPALGLLGFHTLAKNYNP